MTDPAAEKAYEARYGHRQDVLHDPFDRGWNCGWAACEARYRELLKAAIEAENAIAFFCAPYMPKTAEYMENARRIGQELQTALAALSENGEEANG